MVGVLDNAGADVEVAMAVEVRVHVFPFMGVLVVDYSIFVDILFVDNGATLGYGVVEHRRSLGREVNGRRVNGGFVDAEHKIISGSSQGNQLCTVCFCVHSVFN